MEKLWQVLEETPLQTGTFTIQGVFISLLLAFVLGQALAWVYYLTHSGLSYSKSFVQSLIILTVMVAMVITVIGNNIITAFGLMGALALVRFRNVLKDSRDLAFVFSTLVIGLAAGSHRYATAILGTVIVCAIIVYLFLTDFGAHEPRNGFLRFSLKGPIQPDHPVMGILNRFCTSFTLLSRQEAGIAGTAEYAYQVLVRNTSRNEQMLAELEQVNGLDSINLTLQEKILEV